MFAQVSTQLVDSPGFGVAEWLAIASALALVLGAVVGSIVQLARLRRENTVQHAEGRALITNVGDRLLDIHATIDRVDGKVGRLDERLDIHEAKHDQRRPLRW